MRLRPDIALDEVSRGPAAGLRGVRPGDLADGVGGLHLRKLVVAHERRVVGHDGKCCAARAGLSRRR